MNELLRNLRIVEVQANEFVFRYGQLGCIFYIILAGKVSIFTPSPIELEDESATPEGLISFIVHYFYDIHWDSFKNGDVAKKELLNEFGSLGINLKHETVIRVLTKLD